MKRNYDHIKEHMLYQVNIMLNNLVFLNKNIFFFIFQIKKLLLEKSL